MWQNLQWLKAEWAYYFEWRSLYLAKRLEGVNEYELPKRNSPWGYTFAWLGVAVVLPIVVTSAAAVLTMLMIESERVASIVVYVASIFAAVGVIFWIIAALVRVAERGPSEVVERHWTKTHAKDANAS